MLTVSDILYESNLRCSKEVSYYSVIITQYHCSLKAHDNIASEMPEIKHTNRCFTKRTTEFLIDKCTKVKEERKN